MPTTRTAPSNPPLQPVARRTLAAIGQPEYNRTPNKRTLPPSWAKTTYRAYRAAGRPRMQQIGLQGEDCPPIGMGSILLLRYLRQALFIDCLAWLNPSVPPMSLSCGEFSPAAVGVTAQRA